MPIHDWTRIPSGLFHDFHQAWSVEIRNALNRGMMPKGFYAYVEQKVPKSEETVLVAPDVIAIEVGTKRKRRPKPTLHADTAVLEPPRARMIQELESDSAHYARRANRIVVRHQLGAVVAVIEIVSPGNKDSRKAFDSFVEKAVEFLRAGIHLLLVDLFPPAARDPQGIHKAIAEQFLDVPFKLPAGKQLTLVSYRAAPLTAYVEPIAVGDRLPDMPLFLTAEYHVPVPLESTYLATWAVCPEPTRELVETAK